MPISRVGRSPTMCGRYASKTVNTKDARWKMTRSNRFAEKHAKIDSAAGRVVRNDRVEEKFATAQRNGDWNGPLKLT